MILESNLDESLPVLDIGAGKGSITKHLLRLGYRVDAIEKDPQLANRLRNELGDQDTLRVIETDFRSYKPAKQTIFCIF